MKLFFFFLAGVPLNVRAARQNVCRFPSQFRLISIDQLSYQAPTQGNQTIDTSHEKVGNEKTNQIHR